MHKINVMLCKLCWRRVGFLAKLAVLRQVVEAFARQRLLVQSLKYEIFFALVRPSAVIELIVA